LDRKDLDILNLYTFRMAVDVHSICLSDEKLYVVSTGTDEVLELGIRGKEVRSENVFWRPDPDGPRADVYHLNGLCAWRGGLLVSGFGRKSGQLWSSAQDGFILNTINGAVIASAIYHPHSIAALNDKIAYCESSKMAVRVVGDDRQQCLPGYTRGLCQVAERLYAGTSRGRKASKSTGIIHNPCNVGEPQGKCSVSRLSGDGFGLEQTVDLSAFSAEIYDLLPVEEVRHWAVVPSLVWRDAAIRELKTALDERTAWAKRASAEVVSRDARIVALQGEAQRGAEAQREVKELCREIARHNDQLTSLSADVDLLLQVMQPALQRLAPEASSYLQYRQMIRRLRQVVNTALPVEATVLVVNKGDEEPLKLGGGRVWHFPQDGEGNYPGFPPADSSSAVVQLEALRVKGAQYLVFPATAAWWLDHYTGLKKHLDRYYRLLVEREDTCVIYSLHERPSEARSGTGLERLIEEYARGFGRYPAILDWGTSLKLAGSYPTCAVFSPPAGMGDTLPYLDHTVDFVAVASGDPARLAEARRVASAAVLVWPPEGSNGHSGLKSEWLTRAKVAPPPTVSIIIPSYNGIALTEACLAALAETLPGDFQGEIIVVDDCSTDGTQVRLAGLTNNEPRLKVVRNSQNSGFLVTCNNGADAAVGEILIFLNNDTLPQRGWLEPLLRIFQERPDAGAVGGKLVYPDGRLQEAGGVVFSDGSAANFGKWDYELEYPLYNYVRQVDYVTGALIATRRSLFNDLGGLDTRYRPIYYEETDYCFKLREKGYKIYYQPESVVIHLEGVTCGTDPGSGQKRYQVINREKFRERWREALQGQPTAPGIFDRAAWHKLATLTTQAAKRALMCAPLLPEFDREGGSERIYHTIEYLQEAGWAVTFVADNGRGGERYVRHLQQRGVATYCGFGQQTDDMIGASTFDLAIFAFWHLAEKHLATIRKLSPNTRILVDTIDLHFVRNARRIFQGLSAGSGRMLDLHYTTDLGRELNTYAAADGVLTVSQKEADLINDLTGDPQLALTAPDAEELAPSVLPFEERRGIVFIGNFRHPPNVQAVEYLCREVLPRVDQRLLQQHPVFVVGNGLDDRVRALAQGVDNVTMVGWVPSVVPYLERCRATVIPLLYGAGTKRKLIQALMVGAPAVSTAVGMEGLRLTDGEHVLRADDPEAFADAVTRLVTDRSLWTHLAEKGRAQIRSDHGKEVLKEAWRRVIACAMQRQPKPPLNGGASQDHARRLTAEEYDQLRARIREAIRRTVPAGTIVLVVSRGDDRLLDLAGCTGWHFPQNADGVFAGHYPADSSGVIAHLEGLREKGAQYFLLPATAFWWLDYYKGLRQYLATQGQLVLEEPDVCILYRLAGAAASSAAGSRGAWRLNAGAAPAATGTSLGTENVR
jgi:GT2 family glycosyltransferase